MSATTTVERRTVAEPPVSKPARVRSVERLRLALISLCLALLVFAQSAGNASADTKLDLVVSPLRFLRRSLQLWDPIGAAGQLQNQAYGYLFPMGPFFALTHAVDLPPWEMQRLWESCLVIAGFLGVYRLSERLGVGGFWPRVLAGLGYALAPRTLTELTSISSELMPVAALPWVLLPLVTGARRGSPRRAAALSGTALLFAGGVNAAATLAIMPVPVVWLLTRERGPRRRALLGWWVLAAALASAWWLIPLGLLGRYSPPFLDWIESSSTTTLPTSLLATVRGVDHWESYLGANIWPTGWIFASAPAAIVATAAVAGAGFSGLARRRIPHRVFLWAVLLLGLILVTAGHPASVGPLGASTARTLLDGPLVAFRNVHKFDPLIRLPLAIGLGHLLAGIRIPRHVSVRVPRGQLWLPVRALSAAAAIAVGLVALAPALTNHLVSSQRVTTEPGWWRDAGTWLARNGHGARALVVPGSASPVYLWGGTVDNAFQPVAESPWTARDSVPLTQPGYIRLLDSIEQIMSTGAPHPELAPLLARAGIGYVVFANDLDASKSAAARPLFVRSTLTQSGGFTLRSSFGPKVGGSVSSTNLLDGGAGVPHPAIQIYEVRGWKGLAALEPLTGAIAANGSADALPQLVRRGLALDRPVFFGTDAGSAHIPLADEVTTDGIRRQQATFGSLFAKSDTMTAQEPFAGERRAAYDYLPGRSIPLSVMRYIGIADVTASSSGSDPLAYVNHDPSHQPWSAVDGDPRTAWMSGAPSGALRQWLQVTFDSPVSTRTAQIRFAAVSGALPTQLVVHTDTGTLIEGVEPTTELQKIAVPAGPTRTLRVTVSELADHTFGTGVGIADLDVPGVGASRTLAVPGMPAPNMLAFDAALGYRGACIGSSKHVVCDPSYAASGEEDTALDRALTLGVSGRYVPTATVRLVGGPALEAALDGRQPIQAAASSVNSEDPRQRPGALVDGDPGTTWQGAAGDPHPRLILTLDRVRRISGITLSTDAAAAVAAPREVDVSAGGMGWSGVVPEDGRIRFAAPVMARKIVIRVTLANLRTTTSSLSLKTRLLPVGISEIKVDSSPPITAARPPAFVSLGCDAGIAMVVDGIVHPMKVLAQRSAVLAGAPVRARSCDPAPLELAAGEHRLRLPSTDRAAPVAMTLAEPGQSLTAVAASPGSMAVREWGATERRVQVETSAPGVLVIRENANAGWRASVDGHRLTAVRVDGWQQGFVVPAGTHGAIAISYGPQRPFAIGLIIGLLCAIGVVLLATFPVRRSDAPAVGAARFAFPVRALALAAAVTLLSGLYGIGALAVVVLAVVILGRRARGIPIWVGGALIVIAALLQARANIFQLFAQANSAGSQLLCVAGIVCCAIGGAARAPRQGRDP